MQHVPARAAAHALRIHVDHGDRYGLRAARPRLVRGGHHHHHGRFHLVVEADAGPQRQDAGGDLEARIVDAHLVPVAGIGIGDADGADRGAEQVLPDGCRGKHDGDGAAVRQRLGRRRARAHVRVASHLHGRAQAIRRRGGGFHRRGCLREDAHGSGLGAGPREFERAGLDLDGDDRRRCLALARRGLRGADGKGYRLERRQVGVQRGDDDAFRRGDDSWKADLAPIRVDDHERIAVPAELEVARLGVEQDHLAAPRRDRQALPRLECDAWSSARRLPRVNGDLARRHRGALLASRQHGVIRSRHAPHLVPRHDQPTTHSPRSMDDMRHRLISMPNRKNADGKRLKPAENAIIAMQG